MLFRSFKFQGIRTPEGVFNSKLIIKGVSCVEPSRAYNLLNAQVKASKIAEYQVVLSD